jgi:hypothetical protein
MRSGEYEKLIGKFELYPLLGASKDGAIRFELLDANPGFYDHALEQPRPQSMFYLENPTAKRVRVGMYLMGVTNQQCFVHDVDKGSPAEAAGLKMDDIIVSLAINSKKVGMEESFPLPEDSSIRMLTIKVRRNTDKNLILFSDLEAFIPSLVESFLFP